MTYGYHHTYVGHLPTIRRDGLVPAYEFGEPVDEEDVPVVFFTLDPDVALGYERRDGALLRFPVPPEHNVWREDEYVTFSTIPPDHIEIFQNGMWVPLVASKLKAKLLR